MTMEKSPLPYITATIPTTPMQHGYNKQHSTLTTLYTLYNTISKGYHQMAPPASTITIALDMNKAFDTKNIHTRIRTLLHTGIPGTIMKLIANYIKGRKTFIKYRNHTSTRRQCPFTHTINIYTTTTQSTCSDHVICICHHHHIYTYKHECSQ